MLREMVEMAGAVWLWDAGNHCGVTDDRDRAMEHAEAHLPAHGTVLVEKAVLSDSMRGYRHVRTGQRFTARLVAGSARWDEAS
jgi:hypothetical protein